MHTAQKTVHIQNFTGLCFPEFRLNTEIYRLNIQIQSEYRKMMTRKTPNTDTSYAVAFLKMAYLLLHFMFSNDLVILI